MRRLAFAPFLFPALLLAGCAQLLPSAAPPGELPPRGELPARPPSAAGTQYGHVRSIEQIEARGGAALRYEVLVKLEQGKGERWFELGSLDGMRVGERVVIERGRLRRW